MRRMRYSRVSEALPLHSSRLLSSLSCFSAPGAIYLVARIPEWGKSSVKGSWLLVVQHKWAAELVGLGLGLEPARAQSDDWQ